METMDWEGTGRGLSRSGFAKMGWSRGEATYHSGGCGETCGDWGGNRCIFRGSVICCVFGRRESGAEGVREEMERGGAVLGGEYEVTWCPMGG